MLERWFMEFLSSRFTDVPLLLEILNDPDTGEVKLGPGSDPDAVIPVQQALWDLRWVRHDNPDTTYADFVIGEYGPITSRIVTTYKQHYDLHFPPDAPTGFFDEFAGPRTMGKLDLHCDLFDEGQVFTADVIQELSFVSTITDVSPTPDLPATQPVQGTLGVKRTVSIQSDGRADVGIIAYKRGIGAFLVDGDIFAEYDRQGGPGGPFGFPITGIFLEEDGEGSRCEFEHGSIRRANDGGITVIPPDPGDPASDARF